MSRKLPFDITSSPWFAAIVFILFLGSVAYNSSGFSRATDPVYTYMFWTLFLIVLAMGGATWKRKAKVLGLEEPYRGFNVLMLALGASIGGIAYAFLSHQSASIFAGTNLYSIVSKPLYTPLSLPEFSIELGLGGSGSLIFNAWTALTEEFAVLLMWKNLTNWLVKKKVKLTYSAVIAFLISRFLWAILHFSAWPTLTPFSIAMAMVFGVLFTGAYFIVDISGILSPKDPIKWAGFLVAGAISSHFLWDVYVTEGIPAVFNFNTFLVTNFLVMGISIGLMWLIRRNYKKATPSVTVEKPSGMNI